VAGNICVLFTANDAYMRDFRIVVPPDCTTSNRPEENQHALQLIKQVLKADVRPSTELDLRSLHQDAASQAPPDVPQSQSQ
jgi:nicotinamidase-related amidase